MKKIPVIIVIVLAAGMFLFRIGSFYKEHPFSFDEQVYGTLAAEVTQNPLNYNTKALYALSIDQGRALPEYFDRPLFKHPPAFAALVSLSYRLSGMTYYSAFKVSLFFGVGLIVLAYLLCAELFGEKTGLYAAFLMAIEPASWICSQKIWLETTLAFFTVLALYLFIRASKRNNSYLMIASGAAAGLAALTKYPGFLATAVIFIYALLSERALFRKKSFLASLVIPLVMLLPWVYWNWRVYGGDVFMSNAEFIHLAKISAAYINGYWLVILAALLAVAAAAVLWKKTISKKNVYGIIAALVLLTVFAVLRNNIAASFTLVRVPDAGWIMGMFSGQPWYFYAGRLIELSPFYIFTFLGLALFYADRKLSREYFFLFLSAFAVLGFYMLWGNYQSRYITAAVVPMIILSARTQVFMMDALARMPGATSKYIFRAFMVFIVAYAVAKTLLVDYILAVPNTACYF